MTATSARVTYAFGANVVALEPVTNPVLMHISTLVLSTVLQEEIIVGMSSGAAILAAFEFIKNM